MFDQNLSFEIEVQGHRLEVGAVLPVHQSQIRRGLKDLSHESIRNRFHGLKTDFTSAEITQLTALDGWNQYAIGLIEK